MKCLDGGFDNRLLVGDIKAELSDTVRSGRSSLSSSNQTGILQVLKENNIDASKYKLTKTSQEILLDLDWRIADIVKQTDMAKHEIQTVNEQSFRYGYVLGKKVAKV